MSLRARRTSLRLRLSLAAAGLIALALSLAGLGLSLLFDAVLDAHTADDLDRSAKFLAGEVGLASDGGLRLAAEPPDPRYATPYGGLYWQIDRRDREQGTGDLRSRSLWDRRLSLPKTLPAAGRPFDLAGPDGHALVAAARAVTIEPAGSGPGPRIAIPLTITVALDRNTLAASRATYLGLLVPALVGLGTVLALAMSLFVRAALRPFRGLRADLAAIHEGARTLLPGGYPDEVQPLVDDLNRLIGVQERALARARTQAGDMAHGLKTPLAVLTALARRHRDDQGELAREIEAQALAMSGQVERALARARLAAAGGLHRRRCRVAPVVARLVATLRRLPEADSLDWSVDLPDDLAYPGEEADLTEMLGNLLDNARKWAHRRVRVAGLPPDGETVGLVVEDDGPGMSEAAVARIARGMRWDESKPGTGFGIAIAHDIAAETGAALRLGRSPAGGLRAEIAWTRPDRTNAVRAERTPKPPVGVGTQR